MNRLQTANSLSCCRLCIQAIVLLVLAMFMGNIVCFGQADMEMLEKENFVRLSDEVTKKEIASFSIKGSSVMKAYSLSKIRLEQVPLKKCSDKFVYFEKGNVYNSEIIVSISTEDKISRQTLKEVRVVFGRYGLVILPDSAIANIHEPKFCEKYTKRGKPVVSSCKVFRSEDNKRVYIYMINGTTENRYEVTWIIEDRKYNGRVIDRAI